MKRMILLAMMLVPFLCSAQEKEGLYRVDEDGNEIKVEMKAFDYEFTYKSSGSIQIEGVEQNSFEKSDLIYCLHGKKSKNRFKREITFRIYFKEGDDAETIMDHYYVGAFDFEDGDRCIKQDQLPGADIYPKASTHLDPQSKVWQIEDNVYEINIGALKGEYYLMYIDPETGKYVGVYDFRLK